VAKQRRPRRFGTRRYPNDGDAFRFGCRGRKQFRLFDQLLDFVIDTDENRRRKSVILNRLLGASVRAPFLIALAATSVIAPAMACTRILWNEPGTPVLIGRTMD